MIQKFIRDGLGYIYLWIDTHCKKFSGAAREVLRLCTSFCPSGTIPRKAAQGDAYNGIGCVLANGLEPVPKEPSILLKAQMMRTYSVIMIVMRVLWKHSARSERWKS